MVPTGRGHRVVREGCAEGARVLALALDDATRREVQGERPAQVAYGRVAAGNRDELLAGKDVLGWS